MKTNEEFALEIWSMSIEKLAADKWIDGIDVNHIDAFLTSGKWDEDSRAKLLADRKAAFAAYQQGDFNTALLIMTALNQTCLLLGYKQAARPLLLAATKSRKGASTGGNTSAKQKKKTAAEWQTNILPRVKRMLAAGRTDSNIAAMIANDTRTENEPVRAPRTVSEFIAKVRKASLKK